MQLGRPCDNGFDGDCGAKARKRRRAELQCAGLEERLLLFNVSSALIQGFSQTSGFPSTPTLFDQITGQSRTQSLVVQGPVTPSGSAATSSPSQLSTALNSAVNAPSSFTAVNSAPAVVKPATAGAVSADFNGDGRIDLKDFDMLRRGLGLRGLNARPMDLNGDGRLDLRDFSVFRARFADASRPLGVAISPPSAARAASPSITIRFDQKVSGLTIGDLRLTRNGANILSGAETLSTTDNKTFVFGGLSQQAAQAGRFDFRVAGPTSNIVSESYSRMQADASATWTNQQSATSVSIQGIPAEPTSQNPNSLRIVFDQVVTGLKLGNVSLTRENGANLLTSAQTLTSTDGRVWTLNNIGALTDKFGVYRVSVNTQGVSDGSGAAVNLTAQARFVSLAEIRSSDQFMRMIMNGSHHFMQPERFTNLDHEDGDSLLTLGTRIQYVADPKVFQSLLGGSAPLGGAVTAAQAKQAYDLLFQHYEADHPEAVTGSYIGARSLKGDQKASDLGQFPIDALSLSKFQNLSVNPVIATSPNNDGTVNINDPATFEALYQNFYREAIGLGSRPKQEIIHFDEVGYVYGEWPKLVELFSRLKTALHQEGVLVSINVGGWPWTKPFNIVGANIQQDLAKMADSVNIESIWSRDASAPGGSFRTVENTQLIINNLRTVMDAGLNISLLPTQHLSNQNVINIANVTEVVVDGEAKLLATLSRDHHIFPSSGRVQEQFQLEGLTGKYAGLNGLRWTAQEVAGHGNQVYLKVEWKTLAALKSEKGITGAIAFTGGQFHDLQANTRMNAALALLARDVGDKIAVHYSPGYTFPGDGDPNNVENWWYWPAQLGRPTSEYVIDSVASNGEILAMHRNFANGVLTVHPSEGWVNVQLNKTPHVSAIG